MKAMKLIMSSLVLLLISGFAGISVAQDNSYYMPAEFVIMKSNQPIISNARILKTYDIIYKDSGLKARIAVDDSNRKCKKYLVVSGDFAIQYSCNGSVLGAQKVEEGYIEDGIPATDERLNRAEYFKQKVLTQVKKEEMEQIELISVFFPRLLTNEVIMATK